MAHRRKALAQPRSSRHQRDLQALRQAAQAAPRPVPAGVRPLAAPPAAPAAPVVRRTLNWHAAPGESLLVPRRLAPQELPDYPAAVRCLIDLTAQGLPTPPALRQQLRTIDVDTLQAAIMEGIHRWHTYH